MSTSSLAHRTRAKGLGMAESIAFAAAVSRLAALRFSHIPAACAFVAPCRPGASSAIIDRFRHSRALHRAATADHAFDPSQVFAASNLLEAAGFQQGCYRRRLVEAAFQGQQAAGAQIAQRFADEAPGDV